MYLNPPGSPGTIDPASCHLPPIAHTAYAADPQMRRDLVHALGDPSRVFQPEDARGLLNLLSHVFEAQRHWAPVPMLLWCDGGERIGAGSMDRPPFLLISPAGTGRQRELHAAMLEDLHPGQTSLPAHLPPSNKFSTPPWDIFDVVADMAEATLPPSLRQQPSLATGRRAEPRGMPLRRALVEYLGTREGHRVDVAACLRSEAPRCPAAMAVTVNPPSHPMPSAGLLALLNGRTESASARPGLLPAVHRARVDALARLVRAGGWNEALDRIAPLLLTRLPQTHPLQVGRVHLRLGHGQELKFRPLYATSRQSSIQFDPNSDRVHVAYLPGLGRESHFSGADSHLQAFISNPCRGTRWSVEETRTLLAQLIESAPIVTALGLQIFERWPECDPDIMLRFCLHGRTLQPAGRQLLDPDAPQRDVTALDVLGWEESERGVGSSPGDIEAQGISLAHARWHLGPLGATRAGQDLMTHAGVTGRRMDAAEAQFRRQQFVEQLPQLMYEFNALYPMGSFMAHGHVWLKQILPEEAIGRAKDIAMSIKQQSLLTEHPVGEEMGPSAASPSPNAAASGSGADRQSAGCSAP